LKPPALSSTDKEADSSRSRPHGKLFYGWVIVFVGFVSQLVQGLVNQGFSTYPDLLQKEFDWSKAALAGPRSVTSVQNSVLRPVTGFLVDRFGPRTVVAAGMVAPPAQSAFPQKR